MKRGEIYYIKRRDELNFGVELPKTRPGVIVSSNALNGSLETVEVVYLTTHPNRELMTHVTIEATGITSTALCEMVDHVSTNLVGAYCGTCSEEEMAEIDKALLLSLGINNKDAEMELTKPSKEEEWLRGALCEMKEERDRYAKMVDYFLGGGR